jgi:anti-sigma regulatory factor (Ser/Thr protein kinase)
MRDLSLHVLDLMENGIRAGASALAVTLDVDRDQDRLALTVEDDGRGIGLSVDQVSDPFYTTKPGKRTGLGLSLFRATAEAAGGSFDVVRSALGGACVRATLRLSHLDRQPLGDLAATLSAVVCTNPGLSVTCRLRAGGQECVVTSADLCAELPERERAGLSLARRMSERVRQGMTSLNIEGV